MKTRVYFYRGGVERACTDSQGRPSYRWHDGYSACNDIGQALYPWQTVKECQAEAKRDGIRAVFQNAKHGAPLERQAVEANEVQP